MLKLRPLPLPLTDPACLLATWFGVGRLRPASGTWGSLAALPCAWLLAHYSAPYYLLLASAVVFLLGWYAANRFEAADGSHDASAIVIDEVAGQWLALAVAPLDPLSYLLAFLLFRLFDILKPWPISLIDKRVPGGFGVMADDMLAGLFALLSFLVFWPFLEGLVYK